MIDPSQAIDRVTDVAFRDGRVAATGDGLAGQARTVEDAAGLIVTPGLIDLHTHVYWGGTSLGVDPLGFCREAAARHPQTPAAPDPATMRASAST